MSEVTRRYAEALADIARERGLLDEYGNALGLISRIWSEEPGFRDFLRSPVIKKEQKKDLVAKAFEGRVQAALINFLYLLIDNKRVELLGGIYAEFQSLADKIGNVLHMEIISAGPLDDSQLDRIKSAYRQEYGAAGVRADVRTDPSLIGGVMIKIGDKVIDGTIKGRLQTLQASVIEA